MKATCNDEVSASISVCRVAKPLLIDPLFLANKLNLSKSFLLVRLTTLLFEARGLINSKCAHSSSFITRLPWKLPIKMADSCVTSDAFLSWQPEGKVKQSVDKLQSIGGLL